MNDFLKNGGTKIIILVLALISLLFFIYIFFDNKKVENMTLVVEKKSTKVRLLDLRNEKEGFFVDLQDIQTNENFNAIFLSKLCPLSEKNQLGKVMEINKIVLYQVRNDLKTYTFEGLYDYLCTDKKDTTPTEQNIKK